MRKILTLLLALCLPILALADPGQKCGAGPRVCSGPPGTRIIDGMEVYRECWDYTVTYACIQPTVTDTCGDAAAKGGKLTSSSCLQWVSIDSSFPICITEERQYTFETKPPSTSTKTDCGSQQFCIEGNCFDVGSSGDPDFPKAVAGMEAAREAGAYMDEGSLQLFLGQDNRCSKDVVLNCCKAKGGGGSKWTNSAVAGGSLYMYDVLGVGVGRSPIFGLGFDPVALSLRMADKIIALMLKCDKSEALLSVKRDNRLCHYVGNYCTRKLNLLFTKICLQHKETYCCYNSKISRILNEAFQASSSGMGWGAPEAPMCSGMTIAQFQSLDLAKIDFSEFYDDIKPNLKGADGAVGDATKTVSCFFPGTPGCP